VNWLGPNAPVADAPAGGCEIRGEGPQHAGRPSPRRLQAAPRARRGGGRAAADPQHGVAPGQACVFYAPEDGDDHVLGGGWILRDGMTGAGEMAA
jgi:tRNA-specific 2-thiouridylase